MLHARNSDHCVEMEPPVQITQVGSMDSRATVHPAFTGLFVNTVKNHNVHKQTTLQDEFHLKLVSYLKELFDTIHQEFLRLQLELGLRQLQREHLQLLQRELLQLLQPEYLPQQLRLEQVLFQLLRAVAHVAKINESKIKKHIGNQRAQLVPNRLRLSELIQT